MNILQQIFSDHYEEIKYTLKTRPVVLESIEKMIHCGAPSFGGAMYGCPSCGALKFVPFRCKSRFFPSCGNLYSIQRTTSMSLSSFSAFIGIVSLPSPKLVVETIPSMEFIKRLIIHIPDKHFKMIRYYGLYNSTVSRSDTVLRAKLIPAVHPSKHSFLRSLSRWRLSLIASFSSDPLLCSCGCNLELLFLKFKKTTLDDLLRKVLSYP